MLEVLLRANTWFTSIRLLGVYNIEKSCTSLMRPNSWNSDCYVSDEILYSEFPSDTVIGLTPEIGPKYKYIHFTV